MFERRLTHSYGFSTIEMLMVVGLLGIVTSIAVLQIGVSLPAARGDGAMRIVMSQLNTARELAITQRRRMRVVFINGNEIQILREAPTGPGTTMVSSVLLESGATFSLVPGITQDTPDAFGMSSAVSFGSATQLKFGTEGMFTDQNNQPLNGSVFLAIQNQPRSFRAVTIMGATGRVRGYQWDGRQWKLV
jgi:Tfp pilus assembly protein FimT